MRLSFSSSPTQAFRLLYGRRYLLFLEIKALLTTTYTLILSLFLVVATKAVISKMMYLNLLSTFSVTAKRSALVVALSLALVACGSDDPNTTSATIAPVVMNDTGVTLCADQLEEGLGCSTTAATHPRQDADLGRDVTDNKASDGTAGFNFSISSLGCVTDNITGLVWEVKTADSSSLRANNNTYSWYDSNRAYAADDNGLENGGTCSALASCDTEAYIAAVNQTVLCGYSDWRLPSRAELQSIVDYSEDEPGPMVDSNYFSNAHNTDNVHGLHRDWYWTSQTAAGYAKYAWAISFNTGGDTQMAKHTPQLIRLVRGGS